MLKCKEMKLRLELQRTNGKIFLLNELIRNPYSSADDVLDAKWEKDYLKEKARMIGVRIQRG